MKHPKLRFDLLSVSLVTLFCLIPKESFAFSQCAGSSCQESPIGAEVLIRTAAIESGISSLNPVSRRRIGFMTTQCLLCSTYGTSSRAVFSAIYGQRWANLNGFAVLGRASKTDPVKCFRAVSDWHDDMQYEHARRKSTDTGAAGRQRAHYGMIQSIRESFEAAVQSDNSTITFTDGGLAQADYTAIRPYFLLGRTLHIVQSSFDPQNTIRTGDGLSQIYDFRSHICSSDSPWFRENSTLVNVGSPVSSERVPRLENLSREAKAAVFAIKDVLIAFEQARATPANSRALIDRVIDRWFKLSLAEGYQASTTSSAALTSCQGAVPSQQILSERRSICLRVTGTQGANKPAYRWSAPFVFPVIK